MFNRNLWQYCLALLLFPCLLQASYLEPDDRADHCRAFGGTWKYMKCYSRYEYQQRAVKGDIKQFCKVRGGTFLSTQSFKGRRRSCHSITSKQGLDHYPFADFASLDVYKDVEMACLNVDFSQKDCTTSDSQKTYASFDYTNAPAYGSTAYNLVIESVLDGLANLKRNKKGELIRKNIAANLYHKMIKENLNSCQKACLTKCATATIMDYDHSIGSGPHPYSTEFLYSHRGGVCTEYSRLNKDIGDLTGVPVLMRGTLKGRHSYNYYQINGRWYNGEPQNKRCEFFHTKRTLAEYKKLDPAYDGGRRKVLPRKRYSRRRR